MDGWTVLSPFRTLLRTFGSWFVFQGEGEGAVGLALQPGGD